MPHTNLRIKSTPPFNHSFWTINWSMVASTQHLAGITRSPSPTTAATSRVGTDVVSRHASNMLDQANCSRWRLFRVTWTRLSQAPVCLIEQWERPSRQWLSQPSHHSLALWLGWHGWKPLRRKRWGGGRGISLSIMRFASGIRNFKAESKDILTRWREVG